MGPPTNPMNTKAPPFTAKTELYTEMAEMLQSGEIDKEWTPKMVWDAFPQFQKYPLQAFRAQLNKYKTLHGLMVDKKKAGAAGAAGAANDGVGGPGNHGGCE